MSQRSDDWSQTIRSIREQAASTQLRVSQHAQQEMVEEGISLDDVLHTISNGRILEDYPQHR
jgi:Domain of unknown function (DUF4258)